MALPVIRLASDDKLRTLADRARVRSTEDGDYWDRARGFLLGLVDRKDVSRKEHNWLSELKQELTDPWE